MVESFLNNYENSNLVNGEKAMRYFSDNNEGTSSIFQGKIREQDLSAEQKLNELKGFIEELARKAELKRIELERQAARYVDETLSQVELQIKDDEDYFAGDSQGVFADFFESLFNFCEVDIDPKVYKMLKEKKEKNLLLSIIKFLRDKLKELVKKIFNRDLDLSWDKRLDKEIKELQEKLFSDDLSPEEKMAILERLQALQNLKLKLQLFLVGWVITMFAEIFAINLAAVVEQSATEKEEDKKAEKTSVKEKEVRQEVEIKVNESQLIMPISLFHSAFKTPMPIALDKQERALLPKHIEKSVDSLPKYVIKPKDSEIQKPEKVSTKEAKPEEPKVVVCPPAPEQKQDQSEKRRCKTDNIKSSRRPYKKGIRLSGYQARPLAQQENAHSPKGLTDDIKVEKHASANKGIST